MFLSSITVAAAGSELSVGVTGTIASSLPGAAGLRAAEVIRWIWLEGAGRMIRGLGPSLSPFKPLASSVPSLLPPATIAREVFSRDVVKVVSQRRIADIWVAEVRVEGPCGVDQLQIRMIHSKRLLLDRREREGDRAEVKTSLLAMAANPL